MHFFQDVTAVKFTGLDHIFNVSSVFCEFSLPFLSAPITIRWYGVIIALLYALFNLNDVMIQRYNRPRILMIMERLKR